MRQLTKSLSMLILTSVAAAQPSPWDWKSITFPDGKRLEFRAHFPPGFDADQPWPVAVVFAPGTQDRADVWDNLAEHWFRQANEHGWVVILPVAPEQGRFHEGGEELLPALLRNLRSGMRIEHNRIHAVGSGAGAASACRVVANQPFEFASLIAIASESIDGADLDRIPKSVCVRIVDSDGGDSPPTWRELLACHAALEPTALDPREQAVSKTVDDWHAAAAQADAEQYFGSFAPEGVFLGTDPGERWTVDSFRRWSTKMFERGSAWIYVPVSRHVTFSPDGSVAWFDEQLGNAQYGECRGTGVLRVIDGAWKISHYSLTVPIPNALLDDVVADIRSHDARQPDTEKRR